jgi:hypothetical protein
MERTARPEWWKEVDDRRSALVERLSLGELASIHGFATIADQVAIESSVFKPFGLAQ